MITATTAKQLTVTAYSLQNGMVQKAFSLKCYPRYGTRKWINITSHSPKKTIRVTSYSWCNGTSPLDPICSCCNSVDSSINISMFSCRSKANAYRYRMFLKFTVYEASFIQKGIISAILNKMMKSFCFHICRFSSLN